MQIVRSERRSSVHGMGAETAGNPACQFAGRLMRAGLRICTHALSRAPPPAPQDGAGAVPYGASSDVGRPHAARD